MTDIATLSRAVRAVCGLGAILVGETDVEMPDGTTVPVASLDLSAAISAIECEALLSAVTVERDRRISAGFGFGENHFQSRPEDRENIAGASTAAFAAIVGGAQAGDYRWHGGDSDFAWIAEDNTPVPMDAHTTFALGRAAMAHKQGLIFAARALKDMTPIPADFATDQYWAVPAAT